MKTFMKETKPGLVVKDLIVLNEKGIIDHDLTTDDMVKNQRAYFWSIEEESLLIHSVISDCQDVPMIYFSIKNGKKCVIDGNHRLKAIIRFKQNEFKLSGSLPDVKGIKLIGHNYETLPDILKNKFNNFILDTKEYTNMPDAEMLTMFCRYNKGINLKPMEIFKVTLGNKIGFLKEIANHPFIMEKLKMSKTSYMHYANYDLALCILMLEANNETGLTLKEKLKFVDFLSQLDDYSESKKNDIIEKLDYLNKSFYKKQSFLTKNNVIMLYLLTSKANVFDVKTSTFLKVVSDFFKKREYSYEYSKYIIINGYYLTSKKMTKKISILSNFFTSKLV